MKNFTVLITILAVTLFSTLAWAPPGGGAVQVRDRNSNNKADVAQAAATLASTVFGLVGLNVQYFYDGSDLRWVIGDQVNTDDIAQTTYMPYHAAFLHYLDETNSDWDRAQGSAAGDGLLATQTGIFTLGLNLFYDGSNYRRWQGITAAHNLTLPVAPWNLSVMMGYDGATLDMLLTGASGELEVTDVATRPGEDSGNDWRKVKKESVATYSPAKETTTDVGTAAVTVLASKEVLDWPNWCVYLENDDDADPFTDADVQVSPDDSTWISLTWTSCDTLAFGEACVYCVASSAYRYVRVQVTAVDANMVDVDAWITANAN